MMSGDYNNLLGGSDGDYYDTWKINIMKNDITKEIQNVLTNLDNGIIDEYYVFDRIKKGRFKKVKNGIVCDVSIGSVRNSVLFSSVGPSIPIKLIFSSQIKSDIDIEVVEYGINNALVKMYLVVSIKEQINMPITSKRSEIQVREPISINLMKGDIPNYYGMVNK